MKRKQILSFALRVNAVICFVGLMITAVAQDTEGYWKWFRSYMGHDQNTSTYKNRIITMETDDEGNVYCFGFFGSDACWGNSPSEGYVAEELGSQVVSLGTYNLLIAKFDTLGNQVWHRIISLNGYNRLYPAAMELRDGQILVAGNCYMDYGGISGYGPWCWFIDTMVTGHDVHALPASLRKPPFCSGHYDFIVTLDLDGQVLNKIFIESYNRTMYPGTQTRGKNNIFINPSLLHRDSEGNICIISPFQYNGNEEDPFTIVVYCGDSTRTYDLYLPGTTGSICSFQSTAYYKFSPDGRLLSHKLLFRETENMMLMRDYYLAHYGSLDSLTEQGWAPFFTLEFLGFAADEEDNLYLSGKLSSHPTQYPSRVFVDSLHSVDCSNGDEVTCGNPFLVKLTPQGDVAWVQQPHFKGASVSYGGIAVADNSVYVLGSVTSDSNQDTLLLGDGVLFDRGGAQEGLAHYYFPLTVRYNSQSGAFINYGTCYYNGWRGMLLAAYGHAQKFVYGNRVFSLAGWVKDENSDKIFIGVWGIDGTFIDTIPLQVDRVQYTHLIQPQPNGDLLVALDIWSNMQIDSVLYYAGPTSRAVFGAYHRDEFAVPYNVGLSPYTKPAMDVKLYPNPGSHTVYVELEGEETLLQEVAVYDMGGRLLRTTTHPKVIVSDFPAGLYLFRIATDKGVRYAKFVKR
jgi:hypothetical protein